MNKIKIMKEKNDFSKYIGSEDYDDLIEKFNNKKLKPSNSIYNSFSYQQTKKSLGLTKAESKLDSLLPKFSEYLHKKNDLKHNIIEFTESINITKKAKMDEISKKRNKNINIIPNKFQELTPSLKTMHHLPKFKKLMNYNKNTQNKFNKINNNNNSSSSLSPNSSYIDSKMRQFEYINYFKSLNKKVTFY